MTEKNTKNSNDNHHENKVLETINNEVKPQPKSKLYLIPRPGNLKDKKTLEKDNRNYQKKIDIFLEEIVGVSTSQGKHIPVFASDIPFRYLRNLGTIIGEYNDVDADIQVLSQDLQNYLDTNVNYKRGLKALLEHLRLDQNESLIYIYLYSMIDDKFDMISYIPSILDKVLGKPSQSIRQSSPARSTTVANNTNKGKSVKR